MKLAIDTTRRSQEKELMDDLNIGGALLEDTLDKIAGINALLGGNQVVLSGIKLLLNNASKDVPITIVDLGCGSGAMMRYLAHFARKSGRRFQLIGIDANSHTLAYAEELSKEYTELEFRNIDVFSKEFDSIPYDIAIATLFMHHFNEKEILRLVKQLATSAKMGVVVNDLHRHRLSFYLFKFFSLFYGNQMTRHDGALSILRGFKRNELLAMAEELQYKSLIKWKWAFRFQWIIRK